MSILYSPTMMHVSKVKRMCVMTSIYCRSVFLFAFQ